MISSRLLLQKYLDDAQKLTNILKADIQFTVQTGLSEIETQLLSLTGEFQQKLLDEASALDPSELQMFTYGLHDHDRGASNLCHCQVRQLGEPAKDSFFRGGLTPCIHKTLTKLPLHGEVVYPELQTDLEKAIQDNVATVFGKIRQGMPTDTFSRAIPTVCGNGQLVTGSAVGVLKEEHPTGTSFGVVKETLEEEGGVVSGITSPSQASGGQEIEDSDVIIVGSTPGCNHPALMKIPMPLHAKGSRPVWTAPCNIFVTPLTEQAQAVDTIQAIMDDEDHHRTLATMTQVAAAALTPSSAVTATGKESLARRLRLTAKELECFQEMIATEVGMGHLLRTAVQEGIEMPASPDIPQPPGLQSVPAAIQPKFPVDGLVLMTGNTSLDTGVNDDGKVNKECPKYVLGEFLLKTNTCDGSWLREPLIQSQTRMAAYTSDSPKVSALQCGFQSLVTGIRPKEGHVSHI